MKIFYTKLTENPALKDIIQSSIIIEIERAGISVISVSTDMTASALLKEEAYAAELAEIYGTPGVLICYVAEEEENLRLELSLHIPETPNLRTRTVKEGKINLAVDTVISEAVEEILYHIKDLIPDLLNITKPSEPETAESVPKAIGESQTEEDSVDLVEKPRMEEAFLELVEGSRTEKTSLETIGKSPESEVARIEHELPDSGFRPLRVSLGAAPFLTVGKVNYYFNLGIMSSLQSGYTFQTSIGSIEAGINLGFLYFEALGFQSSSKNYIIPLGAAGRWGTGFDKNLGAFITVAGGAALFIMEISDTELLFKVTGFASGGGGVGFLFSKNLGITIEIEYILFFEEYYPIMGIIPSIYFDISF